MSKIDMDDGLRRQGGKPLAAWLADLICLGATPAFAIMAAITGMDDGGAAHAHGGSPQDGMVLMYALMAVFHAAPWLRLASTRREGP